MHFFFHFFVTENVSVSVILPVTFYMHIFSNGYETTSNRTLFFIWKIIDYKYFIMYSYIVHVVLFNIFRYLLNVHKYWRIFFIALMLEQPNRLLAPMSSCPPTEMSRGYRCGFSKVHVQWMCVIFLSMFRIVLWTLRLGRSTLIEST